MDNIYSKQFIQQNSPDGGFLQSEEWRKFQETTGKKTFNISGNNFHANIIEHKLPIVGKYFYVPRGPVIRPGNYESGSISQMIAMAKKEKAGWIRIDPNNDEISDLFKKYKSKKAPHDMQPKEIFMIDVRRSEEELLLRMKPKTRYNIRLAEKKGVKVFESREEKYFDEFLRLVKVTAKRDGIVPHPDGYYRKMLETIPEDNLKLYVAEYENKVIVANLVIFYGNTATYLHGASDNEFRNVMAPFLLQWRQVQDAKKAGCEKYDFGGVKTDGDSSWAGITKFKTGFSPNTKPLEFPGSYDVVINQFDYAIYRFFQALRSLIKAISRG